MNSYLQGNVEKYFSKRIYATQFDNKKSETER